MTVIVVAGSSAIKFHANNEAQMAVGLDAHVESCEGIESGVNPQPYGMKEITQGARNRSAAAVIARPGGDIYVGIESGLELIGPDEETVDLAVISIVCPKEGFEIIGCTEGVLVPPSIVLETFARGFDRVTMGEVLAEKYGCDPKNPHSYLTNGKRSRLNYLQTTLETMFKRHLQKRPRG